MHKAGDLPRMQVVFCESILYLNISSVPGWQELLDQGCGLCQWHGHKANHHQGGEDWRQGSIQGYKCKYLQSLWKYLTSGHLDWDSKLSVPWGRPTGPFRLLHCLQLQAGVFLEGRWMMVVEGPGPQVAESKCGCRPWHVPSVDGGARMCFVVGSVCFQQVLYWGLVRTLICFRWWTKSAPRN